MFKKILILVILVLAGVVDVILFRGSWLYDRAKREATDTTKRITILEKEQKSWPLNDLVYYELGKAYFDQGLSRLEDSQLRDKDFQKSYQNYVLSLEVNPFSAYVHFDLAQVLLYMDFLSLPAPLNYFEEYKKAAELTGHNTQIFYEVGKVLFSRWASLTEKEKEMALEILKKIPFGEDQGRLEAFFNIWELNVKDYRIMEKVLPMDLAVYRLFAQYLAEKSLAREERLKLLTTAESLEYDQAKSVYDSGQREFQVYNLKEAFDFFRTSLEIIQKIKFYQNLLGQSLIDPLEFKALERNIYLGLAKCKIEETRRPEEAIGFLRPYLAIEEKTAAVQDLENFLKERGLIEEKLGSSLKNINLFSFELLLNFKQNRYREIVELGKTLEQSFLIIPDSMKGDYVSVLEIIGDSYQKLDYLYESNNFYQKALNIKSEEVGILLKMRKNFERLNDSDGIRRSDESIRKILTLRELAFASLLVPKKETYSQPLIFNGAELELVFDIKEDFSEPLPLISVFFNGQVVWEDYVRGNIFSVKVKTKPGLNSLEIVPQNKPVNLLKLSIHPEEAETLKTNGPFNN